MSGVSAAFLAALLSLFACALAVPPRSPGLHRLATRAAERRRPTARDTTATSPSSLPHPSRHLRARLSRAWLLIPITAATTAVIGPQVLVSTLAVAAVLVLVAKQRTHHQQQELIAARRANVVEALDVLAADLTAGRPPISALEGAASISSDLIPVHAAAKLGADVPAALHRAAATPGAAGLRGLAAAWHVTEESGAAFATLTERLADSLRAEEAVHRQVQSSLAGARSTARILAGLPAFGIIIGYLLGADPLTFLTTTPPGWLCLTAGLALTAAGLQWTARLSALT